MDLSLTPLKLEDSTCSAKVISQIFFPYAPPKFWRLEKGQCWDGKFHQMLVSGGWSQNPWCEMNGIRLLMIHHPLQLWRLDTDSSRTLWKRALKDCWQVLTNLQCHHHHIEDVKLACEFKRQVNLKLLELSEVDTWPSACWDVPMLGDICRTGVSCQCKLMWPCFSLLHLPLNGIQYLGLFVIYSTLFDWSSLCCDISVQCGVYVCASFDMPACQALPDSDILHRWFHRLSRMFWWGGSMMIWWSMETAVDLSPSASPLILRTLCWFHGRPFWACWRRCPRDWWRWFLDSLKGAYYIHTYLYALHSYLWQFAAFQKETQINVNLNESDGKS